MNKIIGLISAFGSEDWIEYSIKQALEYCDEVVVNVDAFTEAMKKHEDTTLERVMKYKDQVRIVDGFFYGVHSVSKAATLNKMIKTSSLFEVGNWVWMFDVDEYYLREDVDRIKDNIFDSDYNCVETDEKYFFINMKKYLTNSRKRLYKISDLSNEYIPTNKWNGPKDNIYKLDGEGLFHYSGLCNHHVKIDLWKTENWATPKEDHVLVKWMKEIYLNYDLNNEEYWINKNNELFGKKQPYWISDFLPDENGCLFNYDGEHPPVIEEAGLPEIEDFRELYNA